ncbi:MAG: ABC transporter ATP-binding protein [Oscillospiraceae bacterium]
MKLLEVKNLEVTFHTLMGEVEAVRGINFEVDRGEILGIVGESGSGKSVTLLTIMGLLQRQKANVRNGEIFFDGQDLLKMQEKELCTLRGKRLAMVFQEPASALNPVVKVEKQLREVYKLHEPAKAKNCSRELEELLEKLNIPDARDVLQKYPFELSGGMKQRIMIAMAMLCKPDLLLADEPTTALDVTTQSEILNLLKLVQKETNCAIILVTHDLGVIAEMAKRVVVMYRGKIMEMGEAEAFFRGARHPYSQDLLNTRPEYFSGRFVSIEGNIPSAHEKLVGCPYYGRCRQAEDRCAARAPEMVSCDGGSVYCCKYERGSV